MTSSADTPRPAPDAADDAPGDRKPGEDLKRRQDKLVDEAVEETFPASDPILAEEGGLRRQPIRST